jgi:Zn finger protein HypA/HybF involved in hydrogenase expression
MSENAVFKCLCCGYKYIEVYIPHVPQERSCPKCGSNDVRRVKTAKK